MYSRNENDGGSDTLKENTEVLYTIQEWHCLKALWYRVLLCGITHRMYFKFWQTKPKKYHFKNCERISIVMPH